MKKLLILSLLLGSISGLNAQLLVFDFNGYGGGATASGTLASNLSGGTISLGGGVSAFGDSNIFAADGFKETSLGGAGNNAITRNDFFSFSLSPDTGFALDIDSINYFITRDNAAPNTGPTDFAVFTSVTGFTSGDELDTFSVPGASLSGTVDLSGVTALDNITGPVEIRFYGWNGDNSAFAGFGDTTGNDLVLNGNVIPEPSTYALIFGGLALGVVFLKRKRDARLETRG